MHPAFSIIVFTTASGAGYGMLFALSVFGLTDTTSLGRGFGLAVVGLALALIGVGLGASTFHLGQPKRAWRAFSQWRTSWLSREGVLAVLSLLLASVFVLEFVMRPAAAPTLVPAVAMIVLAVATVFSTAMIYASLKPIPAWNNHWVPVNYLLLAALSGAVLVHAVARVSGLQVPGLAFVTAFLIPPAALAKWAYWHRIDTRIADSTRESALGIGHLGRVRPLDPPHTEANFVQKEMAFRIARKHGVRLRLIALMTTFAVPFVLTVVALVATQHISTACAVLAALCVMVGVFIERWLFFAEAKHVVTLYY